MQAAAAEDSAPAPATRDSQCVRKYSRFAVGLHKARSIVIRDVAPAENPEERLALFWVKRAQGELSLPEKLANRVGRRLGKPEIQAPAKERYRFDFGGGANEVFNAPMRWVSSKAVKRGWLKQEKEVGFLPLLVLTAPFYSAPLDFIHEKAEQAKASAYLKYDFRFHKLKKELLDHEKEFDVLRKEIKEQPVPNNKAELQKRQALEAEVAEFEEEYREKIRERLNEIEEWHKQSTEIENRYARFVNAYQSEKEKEQLRTNRIRELLKNPLYSDLVEEAGVSAESYAGSQTHPRLTELVENREILFYRYALIPMVIEGRKELRERVEKDPGAAAQLADIQASPVFKAAAQAFREQRINAGDFQRALMEDSYWELERFERWKILGFTPPTRKATGQPITYSEIRKQIADELR
jgi:hypothetical protein